MQALALRAFDYGETSQILHLFTREEGRIHGIANPAKLTHVAPARRP